ncbi:hypothetical protein BH10PSE7_BH10PSE7_10330 [soil metagenome]
MRLPHANPATLSIRWNGAPIEAHEGDTVAAALHASGIRVLTRSRKRHRPQGLSGSFIGSVLGRVDGRPNVRFDLEPVRNGLDASMQNVWPSAQLDVLRCAQLLPARWLYAGFEHNSVIRNGSGLYVWWESLLAHLAGMADPPDASLPHLPIKGRKLNVDTLVIGGGPTGCGAANDAASCGGRVALVTRGATTGRFARMMAAPMPELDPRIEVLAGMEAFGLYRGGTLVACAPAAPDEAGVVVETRHTILATGHRSCPPLVPGNTLPGVLDAHAALTLAAIHGVAPGEAVAVVGTGSEVIIAERLRQLGVNVVATEPVTSLRRFTGRKTVVGIEAAHRIACDCVIHAGPWRSDANLLFQAQAIGSSQLTWGDANDVVRVLSAERDDEPVVVGPDIDETTMVCPCMDVSWGELAHHFEAGETDVEVLKRVTACGMGPCQGTPCWDLMAAVLATLMGEPAETIGRPAYRDPRRAITVAQAAGLDGLVEPDR